MKGLGTFLFFSFWTVLGAVAVAMAASGKGSWLLWVTLLGYLGMFVKWGCLSSEH